MSLAYGSLFLVVIIWGGSFIATSEALKELAPVQLIAARFAIAYGTLWLLGLLLNGRFKEGVLRVDLKSRFEKKDYAFLLLLTFVEPIIYFLFETFALRFAAPVNVAMIIALSPLFTTVIAQVFLKERPGRWFYPALAFSIGGVLLAFAGGTEGFQFHFKKGEAFAAVAMLLVSTYVLLARPLALRYSSYQVTRFQMGFSAVLFIAWILLTRQVPDIPSLKSETLVYVLILGVLASAVAYICLNFAFTKLHARFIGLIGNFIPIITLLASVVILDSRFSFTQILGITVALSASALAIWSDSEALRL